MAKSNEQFSGPAFKKKVLSAYIRNKCLRRLRLSLYKETERIKFGMPPNQKARAGVGQVGEMGRKWQDAKVSELGTLFGPTCIVASAGWPVSRANPQQLSSRLNELSPYQFVVEAAYTSDTHAFRQGMGLVDLVDEFGLPLGLGENHADLVQVLPSCAEAPANEKAEYRLEVLPNGDVRQMADDDIRLRFRIIDIKMASEPGANYFAEVVYYALTLSAWLHEEGHTDRFVVVAASAVWPGSYDDSEVLKAKRKLVASGESVSAEILASAFEKDLEVAPFETFVVQLRRLFTDILPMALLTPWQELSWFVNYSCNGCEFLGYPWTNKEGKKDKNDLWCWQEADRTEHLSQVMGLTRGNARQLEVNNLEELSQLPSDAAVFRKSPTLRAQSLRFPQRAAALRAKVGGLLADAGSDASMPRWPDLRIYVFLDYDLASAVTVTFGMRAFWIEPQPFGTSISFEERHRKNWDQNNGFDEVLVVDLRDAEHLREQTEFLKFLRALRGVLNDTREFDRQDIAAGRRNKPGSGVVRSTYQIFLWDEAQKRHLQRLVSRHLNAIIADGTIRDLAWLFPPPELLAHPDEASTRSPFTLVERVVRNTVAVPLPHHYTLFGVAQHYNTGDFTPPNIFELYRDPLSDLIPGERIQELWERSSGWDDKMQIIKRTTRNKLLALGAVTERLRKDLQRDLMPDRLTAPELTAAVPRPLPNLPPFSRLLYEFTRLNNSLQDMESQTVRAMPPHEREARFRSARLTARLDGKDKTEALSLLSTVSGRIIVNEVHLLVYKLSDNSRDVNLRPGDIGYALSPANQPGFLNLSKKRLVGDGFKITGPGARSQVVTVAEAGLSSVSIVAIDRLNGLIALKRDMVTYLVAVDDDTKTPMTIEEAILVDLSVDVMLDKVQIDALTKKVGLSLQAIGYPEMARHTRGMRLALGVADSSPRDGNFSPVTSAARFLWDGTQLARETVERDALVTRLELEATLERVGTPLNTSQWVAWMGALTNRLSLIWGPPGTGKSQTLRMVIVGALMDANRRGVPLRILVTAHAYTALDNILRGLPTLFEEIMPAVAVDLYRLHGTTQVRPDKYPESIVSIVPKTKRAEQVVMDLQARLDVPHGLVVVGSVPHQVHNLALSHAGAGFTAINRQITEAQKNWFDLVLIDEASQLDVASATLVVTKATEDGAFVLAGDDLQLPPIHQADAPKELEMHVGSVFEYVRHIHDVLPLPLNVNYRSNSTLVGFSRTAGYDKRLRAHSPDLRLDLPNLPNGALMPDNWPEQLLWIEHWAKLIDPSLPATAFIYGDDVTGQVNDFEAAVVGAVVWLLRGRLRNQLLGEREVDGITEKKASSEPYDDESFWEKAVGIVAPHRAQMSRIVGLLQAIFPDDDVEKIRAAVDTVERFQGQERDVIVASFGVGDPDLIEQEDEFLYNKRRFNVLTSRARAKLVVLVSESLVNHLSNDSDVLEESRLLKRFVETYCQPIEALDLPYLEEGSEEIRSGWLFGIKMP